MNSPEPGKPYNWKNQPDRLIYLRKFNGWHQFKKIGDPRPVWCEVRDEDLHMLEETKADVDFTPLNAAEIQSLKVMVYHAISSLMAHDHGRMDQGKEPEKGNRIAYYQGIVAKLEAGRS